MNSEYFENQTDIHSLEIQKEMLLYYLSFIPKKSNLYALMKLDLISFNFRINKLSNEMKDAIRESNTIPEIQ